MKEILAPIDFSAASLNAVLFAAELARRSAASLTIVHILQKNQDEREANDRLNSLASKVKTSSTVELTSNLFVLQGDLVQALEKVIADRQPDLIVMGTKGASGLKKIFIGSNTIRVITHTKTPVLVIPEQATFEKYLKKGKNRIVLATDLNVLENDRALNVLKELALNIIEPKIRILNVRPKNTGLSEAKRAERDMLLEYFHPQIPSERVTVFSKSILEGINYYLEERSADTGLVAMIARDSGHLIQTHYTKEMAAHTHLPLLVLHDIGT